MNGREAVLHEAGDYLGNIQNPAVPVHGIAGVVVVTLHTASGLPTRKRNCAHCLCPSEDGSWVLKFAKMASD